MKMTRGIWRLVFSGAVLAATFASTARAGTLYVGNSDPAVNTVVEITPPSGTPTTFASTSTPYGLAFDTSGNLYVANDAPGTVSKVTPGGTVTQFASGFSEPTGIAFDSSGNLYVSNYTGDHEVSKITPSGAVTLNFTSGFTIPYGLAFGAGSLYVGDFGAGTVSKVNPITGASSFFASISGPTGLAFDSKGNLYVSSFYNDEVYEVTPNGTVTPFASVTSHPYGLAFDSSGNLFVALYLAGEVSEFNSAGTPVNTYTGFSEPVFLAIAPSAVPEPSSVTLFGLGAAGLVWYGWRCRKREF
jgi:sugar lactone lactonase YvrE